MNYVKIYNQIITRAKTRILDGYKEKHHIIPRCMGGTDDISNLVELTAREHFIAHWLLARIYTTNKSIVYAFWMMSNKCKNKKQSDRYTASSRAYEEAKALRSKFGPWNKGLVGSKQSEETILKRSIAIKKSWESRSRIVSDETRKKMSDSSKRRVSAPNKGKKFTEEEKRARIERMKERGTLKGPNKGKKFTDEHKQKISKAHKHKKHEL